MRVDWKRVDLYGKMGVSKIVRKIEGKWVGEWEWERGVWVMGMVWVVIKVRGFGVFLENEWECGEKFKRGGLRGGWWLVYR